VLKRQHGRVHAAATKAFKRVQVFCKQIAEALEHPETRLDAQKAVGPESTGGHVDDRYGSEGDPEAAPSDQDDVPKLPVCGKCGGSLTFPFWYCIFCKGPSAGSSLSEPP
jgi:hypothetical protein